MAVLAVTHQLRAQGTLLVLVYAERWRTGGTSGRVNTLLALRYQDRAVLAALVSGQSVASDAESAVVFILAEVTLWNGL